MFKATTATKKINKLRKRIRAIQGGTSASKTISILLLLINKAQLDTKKTLTSIVSESFPHLAKGAMRDFLNIMEEHNYFNPYRWNKTDHIYTFENGSKIEFFSADQAGKVRGPRRDRLFINEANNISYDTFDQLEIRTNDFIYLDWNPTTEFWFYDKVMNRPDVDHLIITYKDNEGLAPSIVESIEQRKNNKIWWQVYGLGQLGEVDTRIYTGWKIIDDIPHEARLERRWLDFGYTNDPSSMGDIYYWNNAYIINELLYMKGMSNKRIADFVLAQQIKDALVVADSAEPKSIDEIASYGVPIVGSQKGKGSVNRGIQYVQGQRIFITKSSINTIKEYRNYVWLTDKDGKVLNEEDPACANHSMSGIRYALSDLNPGWDKEEENRPTSEFGSKGSILGGQEFGPEPDFGGGQHTPFHFDD